MTKTPYYNDIVAPKVVAPEELADTVAALRSEGKSIATLNGSFDMLHAGHMHIIYEASKCADVLVVALNSDASIQRYKSAERPIIPLEYRMQMLAALSFVGYITWFDEVNPCAVLEVIKPDVHVNGIEYGGDCIEAAVVKKNGGTIHLVDIVEGLSTSQIVEKIQKS
ncbi:MAG: adenylyltransferase/cytidyltransferase family protein [Waddliaceae bacterium]|jgi:D-glycero-beta-D-manno-heptose 1-phosphate adenylyltransferase|nr:adenylyltransferase/cytidyltransferase family protein [Waddliaceae bacterium]MBT3578512.1 adenylyltransferase/cytidyltransferase family protein [Waddliaceae bacterium]MBT4444900.1 adenylyltransferase/cytidyltransferase family protein [Waddliaceae bacterium]MBT6928736.1 adenylyltransferase/cytidyltransferase family protein [Waddliaceae bacterium]MBT7264754.1 adenylyltransferase/cytidyltransferase family protein [Waddliaceae bacterium]